MATMILSMVLLCAAFVWMAWLGEKIGDWLDPEEDTEKEID